MSLDPPNPGEIIRKLFVHCDAIDRHLSAPMLKERAAYLAGLLAIGRRPQYVGQIASTVCHLIPLLGSIELRAVDEGAIAAASERWIRQSQMYGRSSGSTDVRGFKAVARSWSRFLGVYIAANTRFRFESAYADFMQSMRSELYYLPSSIQSCASPVRQFLNWASVAHESVASITLHHIDVFISEQRLRSWSPRTIVDSCWALRTFFRYAERRGWISAGLGSRIKTARSKFRKNSLIVPSWRQVRRVIADLDDEKPSHCRAKVVLLLASIYGLRSAEIVRLALEDLDWRNEVLTVHRAKRGKIQRFPLQYDVGDAIIRYLQKVRPKSPYRNVFLTLKTPYRPVTNIANAVRAVLNAQGILRCTGLHAFRHACATELLRKGTSLRGIADFLGHRSLRSVSIYAHCDDRALRAVSRFGLHGVL